MCDSVAKILTPLRFSVSVGSETDRKVQGTISAEFEDHAILYIAREFSTSPFGSERASF